MRYQDYIYPQTNISCLTNKVINSTTFSSDTDTFIPPTYDLIGSGSIETGTTRTSNGVYLIDTQTSIPMLMTFSDVSNFSTYEMNINNSYYKFNEDESEFVSPSTFTTNFFNKTNLTGNNISYTLNLNNLELDSEYIIKTNIKYNPTTEYLKKLNSSVTYSLSPKGDSYGIYNKENDFYIALISQAVIPIFNLTDYNDQVGTLTNESFIVGVDVENTITLTQEPAGDVIVSLNGLTLSTLGDYSINNRVITIHGDLYENDIINVTYVVSGSGNGLIIENILVDDDITSGTTDNEDTNLIYYNTDLSKYEVFTKSDPVNNNDAILTLNGITLAPYRDYTPSTSNPRKFILSGPVYSSGDLSDGNTGALADIITITYNRNSTYVGTINTQVFTVEWSVNPAPTKANGVFNILVGTDNTFTTVLFSDTVDYVVNTSSYSMNINVGDYVGKAVYKVVNNKNFLIASGDIITSESTSEEISIEIKL